MEIFAYFAFEKFAYSKKSIIFALDFRESPLPKPDCSPAPRHLLNRTLTFPHPTAPYIYFVYIP